MQRAVRGLCADADPQKLILKPWRVSTNCPQVYGALDKRYYPGHDYHHKCAGKHTKSTEDYTSDMVKCVHNAFKSACRRSNKLFQNRYTRHDTTGYFALPGPHGPKWGVVKQRVTKDSRTGRTIADEWVSDLSKKEWARALPGGVTKVTTTFHY